MRVERQPLRSSSSGGRSWSRRAVAIPVALLAVVAAACSSSPTQKAANYITQGLTAQNAGNLPAAQSDYEQAVKQQPNNKAAIYDLALAQQLQSNTADAITNYRKALVIDPNYVAALYNLAILETKTDPLQAETLYQQAIAVDPTDSSAHLNLGFLLLSLNQHSAGIKELRKAVALAPSLASRIPSDISLGDTSTSTTTTPTTPAGATTTTVATQP